MKISQKARFEKNYIVWKPFSMLPVKVKAFNCLRRTIQYGNNTLTLFISFSAKSLRRTIQYGNLLLFQCSKSLMDRTEWYCKFQQEFEKNYIVWKHRCYRVSEQPVTFVWFEKNYIVWKHIVFVSKNRARKEFEKNYIVWKPVL